MKALGRPHRMGYQVHSGEQTFGRPRHPIPFRISLSTPYLGPLARLPLTLPLLLAIPVPRTLGILDTLLFPTELPPRGMPLPLVLNPLVPLVDVAVPACLLLSSSSACRFASSRRFCSSATRRSAACCFCIASVSMSRRSCVAPFHVGS